MTDATSEDVRHSSEDAPGHLACRSSRRRFLHRAATLTTGAIAAGSIRSTAAARAAASRTTPTRRQAADQVSFALTVEDLPRVQPLLADFAAQTGVTVTATAFPDLYRQLNIDLLLGSCSFDVVSMDDPWMPVFAGGGLLTDLDELARREGIDLDLEDFVPNFLVLGRPPAAPGTRAIPWVGNVQVFAWRSDVLAELGLPRPLTWDEVVANARAVNESGRPDLFGVGIRGEPGNSAATTFLPILRGYGADIFDPSWEPRLTTEAAQAAMATLLTLAGLAPPGVVAVGHEQLGTQLYTGRIAQAADIWPNQMLQVADPELSSVIGKVAIGAEPAQPGASPASMTGNWLLGIPAGCTARARPALDFIGWLTAPAQQKRLLLDHGLPATRLSVLQDPETVARLPFLPGLLEAATTAAPRPRTVLYPAVEEILGRWVGEAIAGQVDGDTALDRANQEIRGLLVREGVLAE